MAAFFHSIRFRLLLLVLLVTLPALALALYSGLEQRRASIQEVEQYTMLLARYASQQHQHLIESTRRFLFDFALSIQIAQRDGRDPDTLFTPELLQSHPSYANIGLVDPDGTVRCSAVPVGQPVNLADRLYFQRAMKWRTFAIGDYQIGRITGVPSLGCSLPILTAEGQVSGVLYAALKVEELDQLVVMNSLPSGSSFLLVDRSGLILVRHPDSAKWVGRKVPEEPLIQAMLAHESEGSIRARGVDGVDRLHGFLPLQVDPQGPSLYVSVGVPAAAALADADRMLARNLIVLGLVTLAAAGLAWSVSSRLIVRQVETLLKAVSRLQAGDSAARAGVVAESGEFGQLARHFNEMAETLERREADKRQAEELLRLQSAALASAANAIIITDRVGRIIYINPAFTKLTGYTPAEIIGENPRRLKSGQHDPAFYQQMWKTVLAGNVWHGEVVNRRKDGTLYTEEQTIAPVRDEQGTICHFIGIQHDVTARRQAERALQESEERFRSLSASSPVGIILTDVRGNCTYANPRCRHLLGLTLMQTMGIGWTTAIQAEDRPLLVEQWQAQAGAGREFARELRLAAGEGAQVKWIHLRASPMLSDGGQLEGHVVTVEDVTERKHALEALQESEGRFRSVVESARDAIFTLAVDGRITSLNSFFEQSTGWPVAEWIGQPFVDLIHPEDAGHAVELFLSILRGQSVPMAELRVRGRAGDYIVGEFTVTPQIHGNRVVGVLGIARDISERKRLEQQFLQAQKMEAVGRLAGGVAHDFNNILTAILGFSELSLRQAAAGSSLHRHLSEIRKAGERATALTRQLLAFSRKQILETKVVDLNSLVADSAKMLRRLIGEDIELIMVPGAALGLVKVDPGQMDQVLLNMAVNARDAMPQGGRLTVRTMNVTVEETMPDRPADLRPGAYVALEVSDTGIGMAPEVRAHLFEPFFTTKPSGRGTGLGLATCYGIVKQSGGHITVESTPGQGSTFTVYLPRVEAPAAVVAAAPEAQALPGGNEVVLLVEDERAVRELVATELHQLGYQVLDAANGEEALRLVKQRNGHRIDLLVTDVIMPQVGGKELADRLHELDPQLRVLFTSGYTADAIVHHGVLQPGIAFLQKPFRITALAAKVREVLDRPAPKNSVNV